MEARLQALEDRVRIEQLLMRRYEDELVKRDGEWLFKKRLVLADFNTAWAP